MIPKGMRSSFEGGLSCISSERDGLGGDGAQDQVHDGGDDDENLQRLLCENRIGLIPKEEGGPYGQDGEGVEPCRSTLPKFFALFHIKEGERWKYYIS